MGNLFNTNIPLGSPGRASILRSVFESRPISNGMQQLSCDVVFGSPSANCLGTGVCKISAATSMPSHANQPRNCKHVAAILQSIEDGAGVSLVIAREMMCLQLWRTQFRSGELKLHEPCSLPKEITSALSLKFNALKPGIYHIEEVNGFFRINFR